MKEPLKLIHVAAWARTTGGVETLLARHAARDAGNGFVSEQLSLFDRIPAKPGECYVTQGFSWRSTPRSMRKAMQATFASRRGALVLWHNGWGVSWFADVDQSARRIVCLWDSAIHFGPWLAKVAPLVDGLVCMSEAASKDVRRLLPDFPTERQTVLPVPVELPENPAIARTPQRECVIGCAGRLVRGQKRWDRLVPFVAELRRLAVPYRIEISGDGPFRGWLERNLGRDPGVKFLGWQAGSDYRRRIQTWDAAIFFSDHEGGPIVLLEAMAAGVVPFYPAIGGSLGDDYVPKLDPRCYYPRGNAEAAARAVAEVMALPTTKLAAMTECGRQLVAPHLAGNYEEAFAEFARRIAGLPRISPEARGGRAPQWFDRVPLGFITRCFPGALWR